MIDLTPLDVRKKKGDFRRGLRGYDAPQVDDFLDVVADRLDTVVRENASFHERLARLEQQVADYREREKALTEALVTAQEMREEMRAQSAREADLSRRHAEQDAARIRAEVSQLREREEENLRRLRARQLQFLNTYRGFLERELSELETAARGIELDGAMVEPPAAPPPSRGPAPSDADWEAAGTPDEWATAPPRRVERTAFAAGVAGASVRPQPEPAVPPPAQKQPTEPIQPPPQAPPPVAEKPRPSLSDWAAPVEAPTPAEAELILSDDDVLSDPDLEADMDLLFGGGGEAADSPKGDAFGSEFAPPARPRDSFGLDLVPEFEDFSGVGNLPGQGLSANQEPPPAPRRRADADDDPEDLLSSLFGDDR